MARIGDEVGSVPARQPLRVSGKGRRIAGIRLIPHAGHGAGKPPDETARDIGNPGVGQQEIGPRPSQMPGHPEKAGQASQQMSPPYSGNDLPGNAALLAKSCAGSGARDRPDPDLRAAFLPKVPRQQDRPTFRPPHGQRMKYDRDPLIFQWTHRTFEGLAWRLLQAAGIVPFP